MIVIGLTGYKGSGKSSVADILVRDYGFTALAFADPLKRMLRKLDPVVGYDAGGYYCSCESCSTTFTPIYLNELYDEYSLTDQEIKDSDYGDEVRRLWERFGTEVIRGADEDFWVRMAEKELWRKVALGKSRFVFTDVRFENEAEWVLDREEGGHISALWKVHRPGFTAGDHAAEQMAGLLGEQVTIINDGSLEGLEEPVAVAMDLTLEDEIPGQLSFELEGL